MLLACKGSTRTLLTSSRCLHCSMLRGGFTRAGVVRREELSCCFCSVQCRAQVIQFPHTKPSIVLLGVAVPETQCGSACVHLFRHGLLTHVHCCGCELVVCDTYDRLYLSFWVSGGLKAWQVDYACCAPPQGLLIWKTKFAIGMLSLL